MHLVVMLIVTHLLSLSIAVLGSNTAADHRGPISRYKKGKLCVCITAGENCTAAVSHTVRISH